MTIIPTDAAPSSDADTATRKALRGAPAVAAADFRAAMSRLAASVHVITTDGSAGRRGVTITAMSSVSDAPATVLFCLNRRSGFGPLVMENGVFCINTLASGPQNEALADAFAGRGDLDIPARFALGNWSPLVTGAPSLESARVSLDCRLTAQQDVATHTVYFGEVLALRHGAPCRALVYHDRGYDEL